MLGTNPETVNYVLQTYATSDVIPVAGAALARFTPPSTKTPT